MKYFLLLLALLSPIFVCAQTKTLIVQGFRNGDQYELRLNDNSLQDTLDSLFLIPGDIVVIHVSGNSSVQLEQWKATYQWETRETVFLFWPKITKHKKPFTDDFYAYLGSNIRLLISLVDIENNQVIEKWDCTSLGTHTFTMLFCPAKITILGQADSSYSHSRPGGLPGDACLVSGPNRVWYMPDAQIWYTVTVTIQRANH